MWHEPSKKKNFWFGVQGFKIWECVTSAVIYILRKAGFESLLVKGESVAKCVTILNE